MLLVAAATLAARPAVAQAPDLAASISRLAALDYAARMGAARQVRRAPAPEAVAALAEAARSSQDQFVRYRALVLVTGFNARETPGLMRNLMDDRNDRVREVAYRWFEQHPDPQMTAALLLKLDAEQAEFVRPALIRALAATDEDVAVQRALAAEIGRGLDFFRSAVIEAAGQAKARWAVAPLTALLEIDGPLRDDVVIALGRIGDRQALPAIQALTNPRSEVAMAALAARCLLGDDCAAQVARLSEATGSRLASPEAVRAGTMALAAIGFEHESAVAALFALLETPAVRSSAVAAIGTLALREPQVFLAWLAGVPAPRQEAAVAVLREAFERFEEDYAEEQFFAAARAAYWDAAEGSAARTLMAGAIDKLDF